MLEYWCSEFKSEEKYVLFFSDYTVQQQMGGISVTDNTPLDELLDVSKIEEVIEGVRNMQLLIIQGQLQRYVRIL
ncbi:MAG: hypothetical protein ACXADU_09400 [Promethearchaeota archaeon]